MRSKVSKNSFFNQSQLKEKEKMTENREVIDLIDVVIKNPLVSKQNEMIAQLNNKLLR